VQDVGRQGFEKLCIAGSAYDTIKILKVTNQLCLKKKQNQTRQQKRGIDVETSMQAVGLSAPPTSSDRAASVKYEIDLQRRRLPKIARGK